MFIPHRLLSFYDPSGFIISKITLNFFRNT
jgi:hypothetical protein